MLPLPVRAMIGEAGVGIGGELGDQRRIVRRSDRRRCTGRMAGSEVAGGAPLMQIAFDGAQTDRKAARDFGLTQAVVEDGVDDTMAEIGGIGFHLLRKPPRQSFCNTL